MVRKEHLTMVDSAILDRLVSSVQSGSKYRHIEASFIRRVGEIELQRQPNFKDAIKSTRNKLHQVCAVYQETEIDYPRWIAALDGLPKEITDQALQGFCRQMMRLHASTRERLPILEEFFSRTLGSLPPITSVLDLACGLNPLAIPWMPLADGASYFACDIYPDMVAFLNQFLTHTHLAGTAAIIDLTQTYPDQPVELVLLLKTLPCLEQIDKSIGARLLDAINARHLLVSFPARSLGGHSKGMVANYEDHFMQLIAGRGWAFQRFEFPSELAFLVTK